MDVTDLPIKYDEKFADRVRSMSWHRSTYGYARRCWEEGCRVRWASMHRLVWAWEYGWENVPRYIDHINGDRMDNRLENLRATTLSLNAHNSRRKPRNLPLPQGVYLNRLSSINPYGCCISHQNKTIYLGVFPTTEEAKARYDDCRRMVMEHEALIAVGQTPEPLVLPVRKGRRGRPRIPGNELARTLRLSGMSVNRVAREMKCSVDAVRRMLREMGMPTNNRQPDVDSIPSPNILDACPAHQKESVE